MVELLTFEENNEILKMLSLMNDPDLAGNETRNTGSLILYKRPIRAQTVSRKHARWL